MLVHKLLVDLAPPFVTAKSWSISDGRTGEILFGKCENDRREIASFISILPVFSHYCILNIGLQVKTKYKTGLLLKFTLCEVREQLHLETQ